MSRPSRIKSFADLAAHLTVRSGASEQQFALSARPEHHPGQPPAPPSAETAPARYQIGWHRARGAFFVLADDDPGYVIRIINLQSAEPELARLAESHSRIAERLTDTTPTQAAKVRALYDTYRRNKHPKVLVRKHLDRVGAALDMLMARFEDGGYIRLQEVASLRTLKDDSEAALRQARVLPGAALAEREIREIETSAAAVVRRVAQHNQEYVRIQIDRHREFFDSVEAKPLTQRQREAVVVEEDRHLVVAGAGTGKTSTIIARIAFLIRHQGVAPEQIVALAYNRTVKEEMRARLARRGITGVIVDTFHGLGAKVIAHMAGRQPSVSQLAEHPGPLRATIWRGLERVKADERRCASLIRFFTEERYSARSEPVYRTLGEYLAATRRSRYLTLDGRYRVKSLAEVRIADWLCRNGIEYEYEAPYPHGSASRKRSVYRPDFFLPASGVYIEHFGIDRRKQTAPYINQENYLRGMQWKRELHKAHGTALVETFQYEASELENVLEKRLLAHGVQLVPRSDEKVLDLIMANHAGPFVGLAGQFLQSFRENLWTIDRVRASLGYAAEPGRTAAFLDVFEGILEEYDTTLRAVGEIDFADMIGHATDALRAGTYRSPFTHVVIDEFQDISQARWDLVQALLEQPGAERKLFAVGDDWQSIYRFSGSDVAIMTQYEKHLGHTERSSLDHTFRFSDRLEKLSTEFICQNPDQLPKQLSADPATGPAASVIHASGTAGLRAALAAIRARSSGDKASVLLLSRYNLDTEQQAAQQSVWREYAELSIERKTIHKAKGAEADFVVVLGLSSKYPGFPSEQMDDPLLRLLVPDSGSYPDGEERRLFYVALTRARRHVYLVAPPETPSRFITELLSERYAGLVQSLNDGGHAVRCTVCRTGILLECRKGGKRYWTCTNGPACDRRAMPCRTCGKAPLIRAEADLRCANPECSHRERMCPRCGGQLIEREKSGAKFLGCSEWRRERPGCFFTEPV